MFGFYERLTNETEIKMRKLGYHFLTNFDKEDLRVYIKASKEYKLDYKIGEAYVPYAGKLNNYNSFYVKNGYGDLSAFWRIFDRIKKEFREEENNIKNLKEGTLIKIITGGYGAMGCDGCEGVITSEKVQDGCSESNLKVKITQKSDNKYTVIDKVWGLAKDCKIEVIKQNTITYRYEYLPYKVNCKITDNDDKVTYSNVDVDTFKFKVILNGNTTIVILDEGSKGIAKCLPEDTYDLNKGIEIAYHKALIKYYQRKIAKLIK